MTLRDLTREKAVVTTAAQLLQRGFSEAEVLYGLGEDQIAAVRALVELWRDEAAEAPTEEVPPARQLDTDGWQQRRKDLRITG